jgi:hypothetical protein
MNLKLHNALGYVGCLLICAALWVFHPAFAVGFVGLLVLACGVYLSRSGAAASIEVRFKPDEEKQ